MTLFEAIRTGQTQDWIRAIELEKTVEQVQRDRAERERRAMENQSNKKDVKRKTQNKAI